MQFFLLTKFSTKEKLEIVIGAAPPHFQNLFAGGFPRRRRRRNAFGLIQEYCTNNKLDGFFEANIRDARSASQWFPPEFRPESKGEFVRYPIIKTAIPGNYFNFNLIDFLKQIHEETFLMQYEF